MTDTKDLPAIGEALELIDRGLGDLQHRRLVSTDEMADLLLDVRTLLATSSSDLGDESVPVGAN